MADKEIMTQEIYDQLCKGEPSTSIKWHGNFLHASNKKFITIKYVAFPSLGIRYKLPKAVRIPQGLSSREKEYYLLCKLLGLKKEKIK